MKSRMVLVCVLMWMLAAATMAQVPAPGQPANTAPILGIWRCQMEDLPAVTLTVTDEGGSLAGAVLFYLHRRDPSQPITATPGVPEPLFHPRFDGNTLTFEVSHRRAHPPRTLNDPPVSFRLELIAPDKAELVNDNERDSNAPVFILVRSEY
ncbi:MAG: hypothetical protein P4L26_03630 [Terracidiphilus sp.]|nr:hypothetical protein [Terracidiphilus sp.]